MNLLMTVMRYEWRVLRLDPALWLVLAMILGMVAYALHNGGNLVERQAATVAAASVEEQERLVKLRKGLDDIEAGRAAPPDAPFRDPRNALFVGGGSAATHVALPAQPLAITAIGQSDLYPATLRVSSGSKDTFFFADEIANPAHLLSGSFDLAFVLVFVYPLWILALTYNLVSGEREQGTLALTVSCPVQVRTVMIGKLLVRAGIPMLITVAAVLAGLAFIVGGALASAGQALAGLVLAIIVYGAFWAVLAAAVNGLGRDSAYNALLLVAAWIAVLLIVPSLINAWAEARYPSPSRAEMVLAVRAASADADRERDAALARYQDEHPQGEELRRGSYRERTLRRLAVQLAATDRSEKIMTAHEAQLQRQHALAERLAYVSPALLMHDALAEIAGTGRSRYRSFFAQVDRFHQEWREFFISRAQAERMLTTDDYGSFPRFGFIDYHGSGTLSRVISALIGIGAPALLLAVLAARGLRRCRVAG
ncbi:MAG: DUF3526 domain-containing protein [Gammaproteobacteria bacterium]|nr:DUF3526 domain-containing protein [Gammaproteobacteria bacterium]